MQDQSNSTFTQFLELPLVLQIEVLSHLPWNELIQTLRVHKSDGKKAHKTKVAAALSKQASIELYTALCKAKAPDLWIKLVLRILIHKGITSALEQLPSIPQGVASSQQALETNPSFVKLIAKLISIAKENGHTAIYDFLSSEEFNIQNVLKTHIKKGYLVWLIQNNQPSVAVRQALILLNTFPPADNPNDIRLQAFRECLNRKAYCYVTDILETCDSQAQLNSFQQLLTDNFNLLNTELMNGLRTQTGHTNRLSSESIASLLRIVLPRLPVDQVDAAVAQIIDLAMKNHYLVVFKEFFESPCFSVSPLDIKTMMEEKCGSYLSDSCAYRSSERMDIPEYLLTKYKAPKKSESEADSEKYMIYLTALKNIAGAGDHPRGFALFQVLCTHCTAIYDKFSLSDILLEGGAVNRAFYFGNRTICEWLIANKHVNLSKLEVRHDFIDTFTPLHLFVAHGWLDLIKLHWDSLKVHLNSFDSDGNTPINIAIRYLYDEKDNGDALIDFLLAQGAVTGTVNKSKRTILHDMIAPNTYRMNYLKRYHLYIHSQLKRLRQFVPLLKDKVNVKNDADNTALDLAFKDLEKRYYTNDNNRGLLAAWKEAVMLLVNHGALCSDFLQLERAAEFEWTDCCEKMLSNKENWKVFGKTPAELLTFAQKHRLPLSLDIISAAHPELTAGVSLQDLMSDDTNDNTAIIEVLLKRGASYEVKLDLRKAISLAHREKYLYLLLAYNKLTLIQFLNAIGLTSSDTKYLKIIDKYPQQYNLEALIVDQGLVDYIGSNAYLAEERSSQLTAMFHIILKKSNLATLSHQSKIAILKKLVALQGGTYSEAAGVKLIIPILLPHFHGIQFDDWKTYYDIMQGLELSKQAALVAEFKQSCTIPNTFSHSAETVKYLNGFRDNDKLTTFIADTKFSNIETFMQDKNLKADIREMLKVKSAWNSISDTITAWKTETGKNKPFKDGYNKSWTGGQNEVQSVLKMMHNYKVWWSYFVHPLRHHRDLARKLFNECKIRNNMSTTELLKTLYEYHGKLLQRAKVNLRGSFRRHLLKCISEVEKKVDHAEVELIRAAAVVPVR